MGGCIDETSRVLGKLEESAENQEKIIRFLADSQSEMQRTLEEMNHKMGAAEHLNNDVMAIRECIDNDIKPCIDALSTRIGKMETSNKVGKAKATGAIMGAGCVGAVATNNGPALIKYILALFTKG